VGERKKRKEKESSPGEKKHDARALWTGKKGNQTRGKKEEYRITLIRFGV